MTIETFTPANDLLDRLNWCAEGLAFELDEDRRERIWRETVGAFLIEWAELPAPAADRAARNLANLMDNLGWHETDDPAWRVELLAFFLLTTLSDRAER